MTWSTLGERFALTVFGESHGHSIGCVISGCPAGVSITAKEIQKEENLKIVIAKAPGVRLPDLDNEIIVEKEDVRSAISHAKAAITTSGTASLECAVLDTPQIVCYKLSAFSGALAKYLNKSPYISMANLIEYCFC